MRDAMQCQYVPDFPDDSHYEDYEDYLSTVSCPARATHRGGRRLYCAGHAPGGSVALDKYATESAMTVEDKAAAYDEAVAHLRRQGWRVVREWRNPMTGRTAQDFETDDREVSPIASNRLGWFGAFKLESYADAPRTGARMRRMLAGLNEVIREKEARSEADRIADCPNKDEHVGEDAGCADCGWTSRDEGQN